MVTAAPPDCEVSSTLVAVTLTRSGKGFEEGATKSPVESIDPHDPGTPQPTPETFQVTCWLSVPVRVALKRCWPLLASETLAGETLTRICGKIVIWADACWLLSAWLTAVTVTGFGDGTPAGDR